MSQLTIRKEGNTIGGLSLGDLEKKDFFIFKNSSKSVPNLYMKNVGGYTRMKTGKRFVTDPEGDQSGSDSADRVIRVDVDMVYRIAE